MKAAERPAPKPTELGAPFWEAAREHRLVRPVCGACGRSFFSPQVACPHCLSEDWSWQESTGRGVVHSFAVVHRPPGPGFTPPYVIADVELEEGWRMLSNVVGDDVAIDLPVEVTWLEVADGAVLPVFRGPA